MLRVYSRYFLKEHFLSFSGENLRHLREKIDSELRKESKSAELNSRQRKIDPNIKRSLSAVELNKTIRGAHKTVSRINTNTVATIVKKNRFFFFFFVRFSQLVFVTF